MVAPRKTPSFVEELLADQQLLQTPVVRAAEAFQAKIGSPKSAIFADLIPLSRPGPGEQYAFEVDLDACTGCKACVAACHSLNGLDDNETWRDVGLLVGGDRRRPFQQTVTTACHHCADPACLNGCPVLAYEKDPVTGIVRHLDDQCIGCSYCILKCPYDVPKFNDRLGIVRKCDMCHGRLAEGEAPACAQACPTHAIRIVTVTTSVSAAGTQVADTSAFLRDAPTPDYTQPTTRYLTRRPQPANIIPADATALRPQPPHWPLVIMLTLLPLAIGCSTLAALLPTTQFVTYYITNTQPLFPENVRDYLTLSACLSGALGLAASVFHLGQPLRAWRIFLGWRKSWLSREAMLFGAWFALAATAALLAQLQPASFFFHPLLFASALTGLLGLFCSVMVYVDTRRVFWRFAQTAPRIFGSMLILGSATAYAFRLTPSVAAAVLALATLLKLAFELRAVRPAGEADDDSPPTPALMTARLFVGPFRVLFGLRLIFALLASVLLPLAIVTQHAPPGATWCVLTFTLLGELAERYLFFRAVDAPKMPGVPA
jgi:formate dehydrogenase iron-sulfur subunit